MTLSGRLRATATGQAEVIGLRTSSRVQSGILVQPEPGTFPGVHDLEQRLERLVLDVGGPVWVCGPTAAALHGFAPFRLEEPFHLLVPADRDLERTDAVFWRSTHTDWCDLGVRDGFPITRPARTIVDLGRTASPAELRAAAQSGLVNDHVLHRRLVALADEAGADSVHDALEQVAHDCWLGAEFRRLLECHGTRRPAVIPIVDGWTGRVARVECTWDHSDLTVVLLGWKARPAAERLDELAATGSRRLVFTYEQLVVEPGRVVADTKHALRASCLPTG